MKLLYGVQGTGNGHLSRAMAMAKALARYPDIEITWVLSGRDNGRQYPGIEHYEWRQGLTLVTDSGRVSLGKTLRKNRLVQLWRDIRNFEVEGYDRIICDFEPIIAHAARRKGIPVTGISHQCAFDYAIPITGETRTSMAIMRNFAPVTTAVGLHWHSFGFPILPPILHIDRPAPEVVVNPKKIIVYLPMENPAAIIEALRPLTGYHFYFYHPQNNDSDLGHIQPRAISPTGFKQDLQTSGAIICNSGFELISESLFLGKAVLAKPLYGQMEQLSNALALRELNYARVIDHVKTDTLAEWLDSNPRPIMLGYPDVAARLAAWIAEGCHESVESLSAELWTQEKINTASLAAGTDAVI